MTRHFSKHYSISEARSLLPKVRRWLGELSECEERMASLAPKVAALLAEGRDAGGRTVNQMVRATVLFKEILEQFRSREIQVKDVARGLVDFPSLRDGREVFLCWEADEDDIEFWHDIDSGYAGRERL